MKLKIIIEIHDAESIDHARDYVEDVSGLMGDGILEYKDSSMKYEVISE